ncbi:MAG: regulatory protein RecX [Bacteroidia bacterium]
MENKKEKKFSINEAKAKIEHYCAYQERCQKEVREKLYSFGLYSDEVEQVLMELVKTNFVNEERFAQAYAGGKFRQKKWGKAKIIRELKWRNISAYCIKKAMKEIDDEDYERSIRNLSEKYASKLSIKNPYLKQKKIMNHLISKGYTYDECHEIVKEMT